MKITLMCDTPDSFLHKYIPRIIEDIKLKGHEVEFIKNADEIKKGDILFLLGCSKILTEEELGKNKHNIVIHPSKLPKGRGSAALIWKILEGENEVYITMFEANEKIDRGDIYFQEKIKFEGHELSDEIRHKQAIKESELMMKFLDKYPNVKTRPQYGEGVYYPRRTPKDSELNVNKTIKDQFNLLRVVDNKRYPGFFYYKGHKYIIKIYKDD